MQLLVADGGKDIGYGDGAADEAEGLGKAFFDAEDYWAGEDGAGIFYAMFLVAEGDP